MADDLLETYRTDHLFLLVGGNPLPNYVAARLLANTDGSTTIWLLYSRSDDGAWTTKDTAEQLKRELGALQKAGKPQFKAIYMKDIPDTDTRKIAEKVAAILTAPEAASGSVGLNYSSGTKPMALHVYRTVEQRCRERERLVFSYLDPRRVALRVDGVEQGMPILSNPTLRAQVEMTVDGLAKLHGYRRVPKGAEWDSGPQFLPLCQAIAQVHTQESSFAAWRKWIREVNCRELPSDPLLSRVRKELDTLGEGSPTPTDVVAKKLRPHAPDGKLEQCTKWFLSSWLEEYALAGFRLSEEREYAQDIGSGRHYQRKGAAYEFDLDVSAMMGHQLFAISCIASKDRNEEQPLEVTAEEQPPKLGQKPAEVKKHLFEVYVRARQLGGDEAHAALICLNEDVRSLLREVEREWDARGKIHVFGRNDLLDLPNKIAQWVESAKR